METRTSRGLEQFCASIAEPPGLSILDLAGANQQTVSFITESGHRLYSDDFLLQLNAFFGDGDFYQNQTDERKIEAFLKATLDFEEQQFDGILLWGSLQFLAPPLLDRVMERLLKIARPGSYLLSMFHADERTGEIPTYSFRIMGRDLLGLIERGGRKPAQPFNNRDLEQLFDQFESVKFFLTRDHLREVVVRR